MNNLCKQIIAGMVIFMIAIVSCQNKKNEVNEPGAKSKDKMQVRVDGFLVTPVLLENKISVSGSILSFDEVSLMTESAGRVVMINLPEGQAVKKGTLLVKLYDDDLQARLKKLQNQLSIQEKILERQTELLKVNGISQFDYDQTYLQVNSLKADIEVEKSMIRKTEILAPFDGIIGLRNISVGAQVGPSTSVATIRSSDKLKLDFSVPEKYSSMINPGLKVNFRVHGNDQTYDATVMATEGGIDASTRNLRVRALINSRSAQLLPGGFSEVELILGQEKNGILIPTQAIIPKERNKSVIISENGKAHFVKVKTGIRKSSYIQILEGIEPGDTVITTGLLFLKEGAKVAFTNVKSAAL